jgi:hypothetical protein
MQLLKPKLIGLVNDDEKHFIMRGSIVPVTFRMLCIQDLIKLQVFVVVNGPGPLSPGGGT